MKEKLKDELNIQLDFLSPEIDDFLKHDFWTEFEAVCVLTGWPKPNLHKLEIDFEGKPFFIFPKTSFCVKKCSKDFQNVYFAILEDIKNGTLKYGNSFEGNGHNYLFHPYDLLLWAIRKKIRLSYDLQKALSINIKRQRQMEPWRNKVEIMIVKQYVTMLHGEITPNKIIDSHLMQTYVLQSTNANRPRQLLKDISKVSKKRSRGWQNNKMHGSKESLMIIPEVLSRHGKIFECDFVLLKEVIMICVFLRSYEIEGMDRILEMKLPEFMLTMVRDEIIRLYLEDSPAIIVQFIERTIEEIYDQFSDLFEYENAPKSILKL